jgi:carboxypeptidase C (cathepsin A)
MCRSRFVRIRFVPILSLAIRLIALILVAACLPLASLLAQSKEETSSVKVEATKTETPKPEQFKAEQQQTKGSVSIGGKTIDYDAYAGTLIVHARDWDDVPQNADPDPKNRAPEASMFYVAYFKADTKSDTKGTPRPVTFFYNGGPGSSTVWLHMGAFGPRRVVTADDTHTPAAPYSLVNNEYSLLDATDLVFVDAPGTGFSRLSGKDKEKAFYGVDQDAWAFSDFIMQFLSKYGRWNSPKFLFGESYGTTRSAVLANLLETERDVDFNGVILLSQILNFSLDSDAPEVNPGVDIAYQLNLPTYAATAWYHHKLPESHPDLKALLAEVEHFAMNDYAVALEAGASLPLDQRHLIVEKLHQYTGLPAAYIEKANLRINGGEFEKNLQDDNGLTTGRLDTRFSGPTFDPLSKEADYDPQSAAISSAYVSVFNDYVRKELKFGEGREYKPETDVFRWWSFQHRQPGMGFAFPGAANVMPDLAMAMKYNPQLKVLLNAGYFDLATPFYEGVYEMQHLPMSIDLQKNIEFQFYESGHMVYAHEASLKAIHDNTAAFIANSSNSKAK